MLHVLDLGGFAIDIEDNFWDNMFGKKNSKYKDWLVEIFL
jgi:hypothetical protein